jgi:hypothetical protein
MLCFREGISLHYKAPKKKKKDPTPSSLLGKATLNLWAADVSWTGTIYMPNVWCNRQEIINKLSLTYYITADKTQSAMLLLYVILSSFVVMEFWKILCCLPLFPLYQQHQHHEKIVYTTQFSL